MSSTNSVAPVANEVTERLFCGVYPGGLVFADRKRERHGDYARCAFLPYSTLLLDVEKDCPKMLLPAINEMAASMQARRGQQFSISTCGQSVVLGAR